MSVDEELTGKFVAVLADHEPLRGGDECSCGWWWDRQEGRSHLEHVAVHLTSAAVEVVYGPA